MNTVGRLQKGNDVKDRNGKKMYSYLSEEIVTGAVHDAMVEHGLVMFPIKTESDIVILEGENYGKPFKTPITKVIVTYKIACSETGEYDEIQTIGYGSDSQDKGSNKAMTGAFKYAQRQTFMISTGDDPDHTSSDVLNHEQEKQQKRAEYQKQQEEQNKATSQQIGTVKLLAKQFGEMKGKSEVEVFEALKGNIGDYGELTNMKKQVADSAIKVLTHWKSIAEKSA
jgi:hypothetical protein